jgi:hypothetical protein
MLPYFRGKIGEHPYFCMKKPADKSASPELLLLCLDSSQQLVVGVRRFFPNASPKRALSVGATVPIHSLINH